MFEVVARCAITNLSSNLDVFFKNDKFMFSLLDADYKVIKCIPTRLIRVLYFL